MADYKLPIITGTSLVVGDLLRWDGNDWVNYPDSNYDRIIHVTHPVDMINGNDLDIRNTPFTADINGAPTATSVVYNGEVNENSLILFSTGLSTGKLILHNLTRSNSRIVTIVNLATNTFTTEASIDDWADDDEITAESQTNGGAANKRYYDIDISDIVPVGTTGIFCSSAITGLTANSFLRLHAYAAHIVALTDSMRVQVANVWLDKTQFCKIIDQKVTINIQSATPGDDCDVRVKIRAYII